LLAFVGTAIGSMIMGSPASAQLGGGHGAGVDSSAGARSFAGPADGHPMWEGSNPPGFSMGKKSGWDDGMPPGWQKGQKRGWKTKTVPPGLYRR
jgi:hypothetical protein